MSSPEKDRAKMEKKLAKARAKAIKNQAAIPEKETVIVRETAMHGKDWRSNVLLYIVVAIVVGLILWGINFILNRYVS